jgi:hypothetical protein
MKWSVFILSRMFAFPSNENNIKTHLFFQVGIIPARARRGQGLTFEVRSNARKSIITGGRTRAVLTFSKFLSIIIQSTVGRVPYEDQVQNKRCP